MLPFRVLLLVAQTLRTVLCHPNIEVVASDPFLRSLNLFMFIAKVESHRRLNNQIHKAGKRKVHKRTDLYTRSDRYRELHDIQLLIRSSVSSHTGLSSRAD
jgi:hypothetical protein